MADPTPYVPSYSYSGWQATNPSKPLPAPQVDNDFANISRSLRETIAALKDVRRSDGELQNGSVGPDQLSAALSLGFTLRGAWTDGAIYSAGDGVVFDSVFYSARVQHEADGATAPPNSDYWNYLFSIDDLVVSGALSLPLDTFVGDGVTTDFNLSFTPGSGRNIWVRVGNLLQSVSQYTISGTTLRFFTAPPTNYEIEVRGLGTTAVLVEPVDGSVTMAKLATDVQDAVEFAAAGAFNSPILFGAKGDSTTNDSVAYAAAEAANDSLFLPSGKVFNLTSAIPADRVSGPGKLKLYSSAFAQDVTLSGFEPQTDVVRGNVSFVPDSYAEKILGETATPGTTNYFNTFAGSGSSRPVDPTRAVTRSTGFGSAIGERAVNWERVEAFGNGAMRFAPYADRVTALGTLAFQWGGGTSQQFLKDTYHDFWLPSSNNGLYPGEEGASKSITGVTQANPGVVTSAAHGYANGQTIKITGVIGMTQLNNGVFVVRNVTTNTFTLEDGWGAAVDTTAYTAYASGGVAKLQWNFLGMESRSPGVGATLAAITDYAAAKEDFTLNVATGRDAGLHAVKGQNLNFYGYQAGTNAFRADDLVGIGTYSLRDGLFLTQTVGIGNYSGRWWQTGTRNLIAGHNAAPTVVSGSRNTIIGPFAANGPTSISDSVILGYQAGIGWGNTLSEVLMVQRGSARAPLIGGAFDTGLLGINVPSRASLTASFHVWDFAGKERFRIGEGTGITRAILEDDGAGAGPILILDRKSASPAASDILGTTRYYGRDSVGNETNYGDLFATLIDPTDGAEAATITLRTIVGGSLVQHLVAGPDGVRVPRPFHVAPGASVTPANNGDVTFQLTSNTSLTFKAKGSDGVVRSGSITLA